MIDKRTIQLIKYLYLYDTYKNQSAFLVRTFFAIIEALFCDSRIALAFLKATYNKI